MNDEQGARVVGCLIVAVFLFGIFAVMMWVILSSYP